MKKLLVALVALSAVGCLKLEIQLSVNPDGSGKVDIDARVKKEFAFMVGDEKHAQQFVQRLNEDYKNVTWGKPKVTNEQNYRRIRVTGYFTDANKVKTPDISLTFAKLQEGFDLKVELTKRRMEAPQVGDDTSKFLDELMKNVMKDLSINFTATMPGAVTEVSGFETKSGRTANIVWDSADLEKVAPDQRIVMTSRSTTAVKETEAEMADWQRGLEAAQAYWEKVRRESPEELIESLHEKLERLKEFAKDPDARRAIDRLKQEVEKLRERMKR